MSRAPTRPAVDQTPTREIRWVAMGDSFTAGINPDECTWAKLVQRQLAAVGPSRLIDLAEAGARINRIEAEQLPVALVSEPDLVTLICGGNDVIGTVRPLTDALALDVDYIFRRVTFQLPAAKLLTATYPPIASHALRPRTRRRVLSGMTALNSIIRDAALRHGFACVELNDHPGQSDVSNYAEDGIHPSGEGHRVAAEVLGSAIRNLLIGNFQEEQ